MMHRHLVPTRALRGLVGAALAAFLALGLAWDARAGSDRFEFRLGARPHL